MLKHSTPIKLSFCAPTPTVYYSKCKLRIHTKICWSIKLRTISANILEIFHISTTQTRKWLENSKTNAMEFQSLNSWDFAQRCIQSYKRADRKLERLKEFREQLLRKIYITSCTRDACI